MKKAHFVYTTDKLDLWQFKKYFCFLRILRGDRPYWWIHETAKWKNVTLQQFELTCETGPGKLINLYQLTEPC